MIRLTLPVPPSVNRLWRATCAGGFPRLYKDDKATAYTSEVRLMARCVEPLRCPVVVELHVHRPRKVGDLDNYLKLVLDSLNGIAFEDDKQVTEIHAYRYDDKRNPRAEVTVRPVAPRSSGLRLELARQHSMIRVRDSSLQE